VFPDGSENGVGEDGDAASSRGPAAHDVARRSSGAGNKQVDASEFAAVAANVEGTISGGIITVVSASQSIDTLARCEAAFTRGNAESLGP